MKIFGSITETVSLVFRKNSQTIAVKPSTAVTYTAARNVELPPQDSNAVIVSADSTQTLTNKTISGSSNTLTVLAASQLSGQVPTTNGGTGISSTATFPANGTVTTDAGSSTLTNKTINGNNNTLTVLAATQLSGIVGVSNGGTGINSSATFPSSGVIVTESGVETLTGKTISGSSNTLTVLAASQLSGATPIANGGTGQTAKTAAYDALSPTTTKGDIEANNGTNNVRLGVGSDGQVLSADSTQTTGLKWVTNAGTTQATATTLGVVKGGTVPGIASGSSIASGYIGEVVYPSSMGTGSQTFPTGSASDVTGASITLTAGIWRITAECSIETDGGVGDTAGWVVLSDSANAKVGRGQKGAYANNGQTNVITASINEVVNISSSATYKLRIFRFSANGTMILYLTNTNYGDSQFFATRIG